MKQNVNEKRYPNITEAVAFRIAFAPMLYTYGNVGWDEIEKEECTRCHYAEQFADFLTPSSPASKTDRAILDTYHYGVSIEVKQLLIENFDDITEDDFRPCRNKTGEIVFYQITPQHVMLPMAEQLKYRELQPCRKCGRVQYRVKRRENKDGYEYGYITNEALNDLNSLNRTYENYQMYLPDYVVSRDVYEFLIKQYPRMEFEPLFLKQ